MLEFSVFCGTSVSTAEKKPSTVINLKTTGIWGEGRKEVHLNFIFEDKLQCYAFQDK